jgi:hypothetical protein
MAELTAQVVMDMSLTSSLSGASLSATVRLGCSSCFLLVDIGRQQSQIHPVPQRQPEVARPIEQCDGTGGEPVSGFLANRHALSYLKRWFHREGLEGEERKMKLPLLQE